MSAYPIFLSVVIGLRNNSQQIETILHQLTNTLSSLVTDYEIIIVDNASSDNSINILKKLTSSSGIPNLQVYALTKEVNKDISSWVGIENALGDFVAVFDPFMDDPSVLPEMLECAVNGNDVVFAKNTQKPMQTIGYSFANRVFNKFYKIFNGIDLVEDAPQYRVLSKRIINFILQHNQPAISYRHLPLTAGFAKSYVEYNRALDKLEPKKLSESIEKGIKLMVSTTRAPMRLVTFLSLFGATANIIYSLYVIMIGFFVEDVAPGWVSMSLQMSGMFFLISLVLLVLGEYILHMASLTNEGPQYHVGQEFTSAKMTRLVKLNIEEVVPTMQKSVGRS